MKGHYGPGFFDLFYSQNQLIRNGTIDGVALNFNTLSIGNGIIDEAIQAEWYPGEFLERGFSLVPAMVIAI